MICSNNINCIHAAALIGSLRQKTDKFTTPFSFQSRVVFVWLLKLMTFLIKINAFIPMNMCVLSLALAHLNLFNRRVMVWVKTFEQTEFRNALHK
jgi:hypothetical protein